MKVINSPKIGSKICQFGFLPGTILALILLVLIKIPFAFGSFWAEDGAFYQQAMDNSFPKDFFDSGGGYLIFVSRIIANLVTLGPIELAPIVNTLFVLSFLGLMVQRLYVSLTYLIKNKSYKIILCFSVLMLPINNVETIASGTALHFQLLFLSLVITLSARQKASFFRVDIIILCIAILSDPFAVIALFPLIIRKREDVFTFWKHKLATAVLLFSSLIAQCIMIIIFQLRGYRELGSSHSLVKTGYLYLDRVIGSALIPNWGLITSESLMEGRVTSQVIVRAVIGLLCGGLVGVFILKHFRKTFINHEMHSKVMVLWVVLLPLMYWLVSGFLFNPEPRYAVFPGLSLLLVVFMLSDHLACEGISVKRTRELSYFIILFAILTWVLSATPSLRRIDGPSWSNEINKAKLMCKNSQLDHVSVKILPTDDNWTIQLQCRSIIKDTGVEKFE